MGGAHPWKAATFDRSAGERRTVVTSLVPADAVLPDWSNDTGSLSFRAKFFRSAQPATSAVPASNISEYLIIFIAKRPIQRTRETPDVPLGRTGPIVDRSVLDKIF